MNWCDGWGGVPIGNPEDPEASPLFQGADASGHFAYMAGGNALSVRDFLRVIMLAEMEESGDEPIADEELEQVLDEMASGFEDSLSAGFPISFDQGVVNFVDWGATANWAAAMATALPEGKKAAGVVSYFDGVSSDAQLAETTYIEIDCADEQIDDGGEPGGDGGEPQDDILALILEAIDVFGSIN